MARVKPIDNPALIKRPDLFRNLMARAKWESRRLWRRGGWTIASGVTCIGLAALAFWSTEKLKEQENVLLKNIQSTQRQDEVRSPETNTAQNDLAQQIAAFYAYLPMHDAIPDQLKRLIHVAHKNNVVLVQAKYEVQPEINADFLRYRISLPVKAAYPDIQTFIIHALQELPTLSLEAVTFKRERIESGDMDAKINYVLLVRKPVAKGRH